MSDSNFSVISHRLRRIDDIDEAWINDCLSDDDIDVPKDIVAQDWDVEDEEDEEDIGPLTITHETWGDLGLDQFLKELTLTIPVETSMHSIRKTAPTTTAR